MAGRDQRIRMAAWQCQQDEVEAMEAMERWQKSVAKLAALAQGCSGENDPHLTKLAELQTACEARDIRVSADNTVAERDAAALIGKSVPTLRRWRNEGPRIPFGRRQGSILYRLRDIAAYLSDADASGDFS